MPAAFDPVALRPRQLDVLLDENVSFARQFAEDPENIMPMFAILAEVVLAHVLGLGDDPRVAEMHRLVLERMEPARWSSWRESASDYSVAAAWETLAIARWLARGIWRAALGVGSLVNLRAISFNAAETDKERLARGAKPYVVGPSWFWDSPLAKQLEAIDVSADPHDLAIWRDHFRALPRLGRVHLRVRAPAPNNGYGYLCRFVLDRDGDRIRLTLQGATSPVGVDPTALATLFGGTAGVFSSLGFERLGQPVTDAPAIAQLLGAYGEVGEIRGEAKLLEL